MNDLISRKSVLKAIEKLHVYGFATLDEDKLIETINKLPSVTPKEKTGRWINNHTQCSNCEWGMEDAVVGSPMRVVFPFCPNCGAKMIEP